MQGEQIASVYVDRGNHDKERGEASGSMGKHWETLGNIGKH